MTQADENADSQRGTHAKKWTFRDKIPARIQDAFELFATLSLKMLHQFLQRTFSFRGPGCAREIHIIHRVRGRLPEAENILLSKRRRRVARFFGHGIHLGSHCANLK